MTACPFYGADEYVSDANSPTGRRLVSRVDYFKLETDADEHAKLFGGVVAAVPNGGPTFWRVRRNRAALGRPYPHSGRPAGGDS